MYVYAHISDCAYTSARPPIPLIVNLGKIACTISSEHHIYKGLAMLHLATILVEMLAEESASVTFVDSLTRGLNALGVTGWKAVVVFLWGSSIWGYLHALKSGVAYRRRMKADRDDSGG